MKKQSFYPEMTHMWSIFTMDCSGDLYLYREHFCWVLVDCSSSWWCVGRRSTFCNQSYCRVPSIVCRGTRCSFSICPWLASGPCNSPLLSYPGFWKAWWSWHPFFSVEEWAVAVGPAFHQHCWYFCAYFGRNELPCAGPLQFSFASEGPILRKHTKVWDGLMLYRPGF